MISLTGNDKIHVYPLNLTSQKDIRRFAKEVGSRFPEIFCLVNNSGIGGGRTDMPWQGTDDGHELVMATNYLGPFTLTHLLMENVLAAGRPGDPSRIVNVSSNLHFLGRMDPDKFERHVHGPHKPSQYRGGRIQYCNSKLLQVYVKNELTRNII